MKRNILKLSVPLLFLTACTKNISDYNKETKKPATVSAGPVFTNATKVLADGLNNASVNINVFRFTVKHWAMAVYQDEANYDFFTRNINGAWWTRMYRDILVNLNDCSKTINNSTTLTADVKANQLAIVDIMQVYTYSILVNTFGNVPYTDALKAEVNFPNYDDAKTVYADLLARLKTDIGNLKPAAGSFAASEDIIYGGKVPMWSKFANSMLVKLGMVIADVDDAAAKSAVEMGAPNVFAAGEKAQFTYLAGSPNYAPLYSDIIVGARPDYVAAIDLLKPLTDLNDPRKSHFFGTNNAGAYAGGVVGKVNTFADMSKPSTQLSAATAPNIFMDYMETEFLLAEAKERGYNVPGTAADHYMNAVKASIISWGGSQAEADAYYAQPQVTYATAIGSNWKEKIAYQKWIGLYNRPYDGWVEIRRFDYPKLTAPFAAISGFPNRLSYPVSEQQVNGGSYTKGAAAIGGDKVETKLFWDKF